MKDSRSKDRRSNRQKLTNEEMEDVKQWRQWQFPLWYIRTLYPQVSISALSRAATGARYK